ncbi:DUF3240 family protein [Rhodoblastus sp.]|uniref:DUF3240 family protein n=1 Tax=Rhodoblastus sp. TaxID=1962975 RepID=UPI0026210A37|nr:DUF3240 family protein [Rhodoblastus sp.]
MDHDLCKLTLVFPSAAEDKILDVLLDSEPPLPGFTSLRAEGHGASFDDVSAREKVRGRVERRMAVLVLARERVETLLTDLRERCPVPDLTYWVESVERFGQFR